MTSNTTGAGESDMVEQIARIISPETWRCIDAWEVLPPSSMAARDRSITKAKEVLKLVGPHSAPARTLQKIPTYVSGVLDVFPMPDGLRSALMSWSDEALEVLRSRSTLTTSTENGDG